MYERSDLTIYRVCLSALWHTALMESNRKELLQTELNMPKQAFNDIF